MALNDLQWLISHNTKPNQTKLGRTFILIVLYTVFYVLLTWARYFLFVLRASQLNGVILCQEIRENVIVRFYSIYFSWSFFKFLPTVICYQEFQSNI